MARTSFITAAAIAGVALAGSAAIVANVGILNAAESTEIGTLSAAGDLLPADPTVVDVYLDDPSVATTVTGAAVSADATPAGSPPAAAVAVPAGGTGAAPAPTTSMPGAVTAGAPAASSGPNAGSQTFAVADAGTVTVGRTSGGLQLGDATANPGWSSRTVRADAWTVVVSFTDGTRTLEFTATPGPEGSITGSIADRSVAASPAPTTTARPPATVSSSDDEDDEHEYEAPEHEGGEDDD